MSQLLITLTLAHLRIGYLVGNPEVGNSEYVGHQDCPPQLLCFPIFVIIISIFTISIMVIIYHIITMISVIIIMVNIYFDCPPHSTHQNIIMNIF